MGKTRRSLDRFIRRERGSAAVELAIVVPILLIFMFGIVDFGHAWYMRHVMSYASREAARYGTRFTGKVPSTLNPSIADYIKKPTAQGGWGLVSSLPTDASPTVTPSGPAWTETQPTALSGKDLVITITATKTWFIAGTLIPGLGSSKLITVNATMKCE